MSPSIISVPHTRSTSTHGSKLANATNGTKPGAMTKSKGITERIFPHIDELKNIRPDIDPNLPLRRLLHDGELFAKQADTHLDFRRPDVAFQEYIKASIVAVELIPRHKDFPALQADWGELHRAYTGLQKRIMAQGPKFEAVKEMIKENNSRNGVKPTQNNANPLSELWHGHTRAKSTLEEPLNGTSKVISLSQQVQDQDVNVLSASDNSVIKKKPPIQPKPDSLLGNALQKSNVASANSPEPDLAVRFARLRTSGLTSPVQQDPRIRTQLIGVGNSPNSPLQSPTLLAGKTSTNLRPSGPREMPSNPTSHSSGKQLLDMRVPEMPRAPDAIYSPSRTSDSPATIPHPASVSRNSSFVGNVKTGAAPPVSALARTPSIEESRGDYFSTLATHDNGTSNDIAHKSGHNSIPNSLTISAEELVEFLKIGSRALRVLLVDLRNRQQFDDGHILAQSIICIEPIVLRHGISAEELGESIVISPDHEQDLYAQRSEFDLVVCYDQSSLSLDASNLSVNSEVDYLRHFVRALHEFAYDKPLKRCPKLLMGGLDAWIDLMGPGSLKVSTASRHPNAPGRATSHGVRSSVPPKKPSRESRPLSKEQENKWEKTLANDIQGEKNATAVKMESEEFSYAKSTEEFLRRYPEVPLPQESMISSSTSTYYQDQALARAMPSPPTRPAPALPRQRSSGISERGPVPVAAYGMTNGSNAITAGIVTRGLTGLDTTGTTCYLNAVIQCLSATVRLREELLFYRFQPGKVPRKDSETSDPPQLLTRHMSYLLKHLWSGHYKYVTPKSFWGYVNAIHSRNQPGPATPPGEMFGGAHKQHDAQEFLNFILHIMSDELNAKRDQLDYTARDIQLEPNEKKERDNMANIDSACKAYKMWLSGSESIIQATFGLQTVSASICKCGYSSKTWSPSLELQANFNETHKLSNEVKLIDLLRAFFSSEKMGINQAWQCDGCGKKAGGKRTIAMSYFPDYLTIHVGRFGQVLPGDPETKKIQTIVTFPLKEIDLEEFAFVKSADGTRLPFALRGLKGPFKYECYAVVAHKGYSLNGGHYVAFARNLDQKNNDAGSWHEFDDKVVKPISESKIAKSQISLIFLKRMDVTI